MKREAREKELQAVEAESKRRDEVIKGQFGEWNVGLYPEGRIKLALVIVFNFMVQNGHGNSQL